MTCSSALQRQIKACSLATRQRFLLLFRSGVSAWQTLFWKLFCYVIRSSSYSRCCNNQSIHMSDWGAHYSRSSYRHHELLQLPLIRFFIASLVWVTSTSITRVRNSIAIAISFSLAPSHRVCSISSSLRRWRAFNWAFKIHSSTPTPTIMRISTRMTRWYPIHYKM